MRLLASVLVLLTSCTSATAPTPNAPPAEPSQLIYVDAQTVKTHDLVSGASEVIARLPTADVAVSPDGAAYAVVRETHPNGPGPEGFRRPVVAVGSLSEQSEPIAVGPGRSPVWGPDGTTIAAISAGAGGDQIVFYDTSGDRLASSPADRGWSLVGWGPGRVVAIGSDAGAVIVSASNGRTRGLDTPATELWGASPTEATYMTVSDREARLEGSTAGSVRGVSGALGDGAWSWTGRHVVAVEINRARSSLVLIDITSGRSIDVTGGRGAQGNVVWSLDGKTFAYVRVDPDARARLQAVVCQTGLDCKPAFSWTEGVRLLGFRNS